MTIDEFRKRGDLVAEWRAVLELPITKIVLAVMEKYSPVYRIVKSDITPTFANIRLGHQTGWAEFAQTIRETILQQPPQTEQLEHTYEDPDPEQPPQE